MTEVQQSIVDLITEAPHMTAQDIAETLGVKMTSVYWTARRYGLTIKSARHCVTDQECRRIASLAKARIPDHEIAARLHFSVITIRRHRHRLGLCSRSGTKPSQPSQEKKEQIIKMHLRDGYTYKEIAKVMGITRSAVAGIVFRFKRDSVHFEKEVEAV